MAEYSIQDALKKMLEQSNWKYQYQVTKLREDWETLMGKTVAKHTNDLQIREGKLYIYTNVAPLKNELNYNKSLLVERINQHFGEQFIKEVIIV
jgi:predicted nucleic acid-binding Zn ribbon protein